jgi:hypothetical protein
VELAFLIRAMAEKQGNTTALVESSELFSRLPPGIFGVASHILLPSILHRYGPITIPRIVGIIARLCRLFRLDMVADFLGTARMLLAGEIALSRILDKLNVRVVVIADDRSLGWDIGVVCAATRRGIRTVTIPFALSDPAADWVHRIHRSQFDLAEGHWITRAIKKKLAVAYPANVRRQDGRELMFLTIGQASALRMWNALPSTPWAYGGGITEFAAVYGTGVKDKQVGLGVAVGKLIVTGQCSMDQLYSMRNNTHQLKAALAENLRLDIKTPIIICAVPPYKELGLMPPTRHWDLTESMVRDLRQTGANLVLSLHPRSQQSEYSDLAARYGAIIAGQSLIQILPVADLFVASHSSTVRWAILLTIPTLVLDDFNVGASGLFDPDGIVLVHTRDTLQERARELLYDKNERQLIRLRLEQQGSLLDPFDGKNTSRLIQLLSKLTAQGQALDCSTSGEKFGG